MVHIFLSDVHLGAHDDLQTQELEKELIELVDFCETREIRIHILGDLFDYWMEYPNYIPSVGKALLERFESYNKAMDFQTTYITGNHDFWTRTHFENLGFQVEHEFMELQLDDQKWFLTHGDGLANPDFNLPRPLFNQFIRHPKFVTFYQFLLPGKTGLNLMKKFSAISRDENHNSPARLNDWAKKMIDNFTYDVVISGHDHIPRMETFSDGMYINTGAFCMFKTLLKYTKGTYELVTWADGFKEFQQSDEQFKADLND